MFQKFPNVSSAIFISGTILLGFLSSCGGGGGGGSGGAGGGDSLGSGGGGPTAPNSPPTAVAAADRSTGEVPLEVTFSAAGSSDPEGALASYSWDFGDGSPADSGETAVHRFTSSGEFTVVLTVSDSVGATAAADLTVTADPLTCPDFSSGTSGGNIESSAIIEASGIAASRRNPGVLWVNNDSGDSARLFALTPSGRHLGIYSIAGASAYDWEDIAVGPGPVEGQSYIFIADIGDNACARSHVSVYRVSEPDVDPEQNPVSTAISGAVRLDMKYAGGADDAESMMVDPENGDLYIVTKRADGNSKVLRYPAPHTPGVQVTMEEVATLHFGSGSLPGSTLATAADISPSGSHVIIKTYSNAFIWLRPYGSTLEEAFAGSPCPVPLRSEPQGEAIGFSSDGMSYFTLSEGTGQPLYRFDRE